MTNEYEWKARIISRNRITIPDLVVKQWGLREGDKIQVTVRRPVKPIKDVII